MSRTAKVLTTLLLSLMISVPAGAVTLTTPVISTNSHQPACTITNIGTKPITVTAELVNGAGNTVTPVSASCPTAPGTLAPRVTCYVAANVGQDAYCIITTSSAKVRAGIALFTDIGDFAGFLPATK